MILAGDLRKGVTFVYDGNIYVVVDFLHVKPGKGAAFVRTKLKNVVTGAVLEKTFNPTEKFEKAMIESKQMEYLYSDGDLYYFMDMETYEQLHGPRELRTGAAQQISGGGRSHVHEREYAGDDKILQGRSLFRRASQLRGAAYHALRTRRCRQHRNKRKQARYA